MWNANKTNAFNNFGTHAETGQTDDSVIGGVAMRSPTSPANNFSLCRKGAYCYRKGHIAELK